MPAAAPVCNHVTRKFFTPPKLAKLLGVGNFKIMEWIKSGELPATNVATKLDGLPRWVIAESDIEEFMARRRSSQPTPKPTRRSKLNDDIPKYI